ncbi:CD209 antigen-like protein C isoform X1 [Anguilla rostrata]|uniref:CD209 antigen-like protein C isoform X1 n=1 Tax=Anguilla rostrata TaxID=7938 RepID=UPI0030D504DF
MLERDLEEPRSNCSTMNKEKVQQQSKYNEIFKKLPFLEQYCASSSQSRVCEPCPQGWSPFSSKCYYFSTERKIWTDSRSDCIKRGADLVIIESEEEQEFITKHTREHPYWIGLSDLKNEGTWLWADKTSLQKGFWRSGEPDDHYGTENKTQGKIKDADCVVTVPDENTWEDTRCFSKYKFVCETDALLF